ncbi:MAG: mechanosensitive ion channel [Desulfobulbaceae bacterium]|jgi:miniconductance mechanosensitive channel|nr:mechanosensitive ion channel [Desulfobulbaceae bacterium]
MTYFTPLTTLLQEQGLHPTLILIINSSLALLVLLVIWILTSRLSRNILADKLEQLTARTHNQWDDAFKSAFFFRRIVSLVPLITCYLIANLLVLDSPPIQQAINSIFFIGILVLGVRILDAALGAAQIIDNSRKKSSSISIRSYLGALRIIYYILAIITCIAIITGKPVTGILGILGGLTAVFVLVFRNSLLGITANIQFSSSKALQKGDWITMEDLHADGVVEDISINMITIRNWDNTVVNVPAFKLLEHPFQNWQAMFQSGGRRIKRSLFIDMNSITFCSEELMSHLQQIDLLAPYLAQKETEITAHNKDRTATGLNSRRQTNLGVFRGYIKAYLQQNEQIHPDMTFMVRHLQPTPQGLPLEIYVFTTDTRWAYYEAIQADIFDHLLAIIPEFNLRIYQYPTGSDFSRLGGIPHAADVSDLVA